jgi:hypothetical protein
LNAGASALPGLLQEVGRVLDPDSPDTLEQVACDVRAGRIGNFHALKWRIAMTLAALIPDMVVPVAEIRRSFERLFPDRAALCRETGWCRADVDTIDRYGGAGYRIGCPTLGLPMDHARPRFAAIEVRRGDEYPPAERCPTIVLRKRGIRSRAAGA